MKHSKELTSMKFKGNTLNTYIYKYSQSDIRFRRFCNSAESPTQVRYVCDKGCMCVCCRNSSVIDQSTVWILRKGCL